MRLKVHTWTCNACGRECETHQARPYKAQICGSCRAKGRNWTRKQVTARNAAARAARWQSKVEAWTKGTP